MDNLLQQGVAAVKAGDRERAYSLLTRAVQDPQLAEQAWLWLSAVVGEDAERLYCLENSLHANPNNVAALRGAEQLRQKGIFPAVPIGPGAPAAARPTVQAAAPARAAAPPQAPQRLAPAAQVFAPAQAQPGGLMPPERNAAGTTLAAQPGGLMPPERNAEEMNALVKYTLQELAHKTPRMVIQKNLLAQGLSAEAADRLLKRTGAALHKVRRDKARKRMMRGFWWMLGGVAVTILTMIFARQLGGTYVLWYGAILVGIIDLAAGFFSWLANG